MRKFLTGIFFTLAILVFAQIAQANTFVECEYGNSDACTAKYGAGIQGHWTYDSHNADGSWTCISDLGQFYCDKPYWGQCAGAFIGNPPKSPGVCWAGLSGNKPPVPASQLLYGPVHPREGTSACSGQAPGDMPSSADLYCVCGVGDAAACPTPTTPPPTPTNTPNPTPHPTTSPTPQPTPTPILTTGNLALQVQGIGLNDVLNPLHPIRRVILYFYPSTDTSFQQTPHVFKGIVTYNGTTGYFSNASFPLTGLLAGPYLVLVRTPEGSLVSQIGTGDGTGPITIVKTGGPNYLVDTQDSQDQNADINVPILSMGNTVQTCSASSCSFNLIDLLDYNALVDCFGTKSTTWDCLIHGIYPGSGDSIADSNDDGQVDGVDFTIMMKNFGHFGIGQNTMNRGGENVGPITPTPLPITPTPIPTATPTLKPSLTPTVSPTHAPTATPTP